jgi:hypothetical protein
MGATTSVRYRLKRPVAPPPADLPGHDLSPRPQDVYDMDTLRQELQDARSFAFNPSFRELSQRCVDNRPSAQTFHNLVHQHRLPPLNTMLIFLCALGYGLELRPWIEAWHRVAALQPEPKDF